MNLIEKFDKTRFFRFLLSLVLAGAALGLYLMTRSSTLTTSDRVRHIAESAVDVDHEVDSVLAHFQIEKSWIRKRNITIPNSSINRIERRIMIPKDVQPVQMNHAMNEMAHRYDGRAVASENMKENSVTIHIDLDGYIVQTIILKPTATLKRNTEDSKVPRL